MKRLWRVLPWVLAFALLAWVLRTVPVGASLRAIRQVGGWQWVALIGLNGLILLVLNGRWWLILRGMGKRVPFWSLFGYRLASFGVSYFTPGPHFGGEPVQVLLLEKEQAVSRETAVASVALDKTIELLINFTFLVGGVLFILQTGLLDGVATWQTAVWGMGLLAIPAGLLGAIWWGKRPFSSFINLIQQRLKHPRLARIQQSVAESEAQTTLLIKKSPLLMWAAFLLSFLSWLGIIYEYGLMLYFLGLELSSTQVLLLLIAARIAILLPLPAGIGTLESSQLFGLALIGMETAVGLAVGLSITLVIRVRDVLLGVVGVAWGWWRLRR